MAATAGKTLRVLLADDERPARRFLSALLKRCSDVEVVGEAATGREALELIEERKPDLALLDLQMPELGGLEVTRLLKAGAAPIIAFVTAFDEFAVQAFELNAVDYLLKPVDQARLEETLARARLRARADHGERARHLQNAAAAADTATRRAYLERIPVRRREEVVILPVRQIASIVAEGELLHITTAQKERYTITYRLHAIESKLDPKRFVRLGRGTLAAIDLIQKVSRAAPTDIRHSPARVVVTPTAPVVLADAGVENVNAQVDELIHTGVLRRLLAFTELKFSNSMIKAWWRSVTSLALPPVARRRHDRSSTGRVSTSTNITACFHTRRFADRRRMRCTSAQGTRFPADLTERAAAARRARVEANRSAACGRCPSINAAA